MQYVISQIPSDEVVVCTWGESDEDFETLRTQHKLLHGPDQLPKGCAMLLGKWAREIFSGDVQIRLQTLAQEYLLAGWQRREVSPRFLKDRYYKISGATGWAVDVDDTSMTIQQILETFKQIGLAARKSVRPVRAPRLHTA